MGCHTWVYEKIENPPKEEELLNYARKTTYETKNMKYSWWDLDYNQNWYTETNFKGNPESKVKILDISKIPEEIHCFFSLVDYHYEMPEAEFHVVSDNTGFYKEMGYHDIFRISNYPEAILHSYEECEKFINSKDVVEELPDGKSSYIDENGCERDYYCLAKSKEETLQICKEWFKEHPNTMIEFG